MGVAPSVATITCDSVVRGRYVIVPIAGLQELLTLCEVEVYGSDGKTTSSMLAKHNNSRAHFHIGEQYFVSRNEANGATW